MSKIIVTGANGFLGSVLIHQLHKESKNVLAFVKAGEDARLFEEQRIPFAYGNVLDKKSIETLIEEGDTIVHLAAIVSISERDKAIVWKVNYEGTKNVLESALERKASRFVYVSSVHAIPFHTGIITEQDVWTSSDETLGAYEKSKKAATKLVLGTACGRLKTTVVFPAGIMGPGDGKVGEISTLIQKIAKNKLPAYVSGGYAFCDVRDVAQIIDKALDEGENGSFLVSGGYLSIKDIILTTMEKTGARRKPIWIPRLFAWTFLPLISAFQPLSKEKPLYTSYSLKITKDKPLFSTAQAERLLGRPLLAPTQSLIDEIEYLRSQNILGTKSTGIKRPKTLISSEK